MNIYIKYGLVVISIILLIGVIINWLVLKAVDVDIPSSTNFYVISFNDINEQVYIRSKSWGISGNHNEIIFSTTPLQEEIRYSEEKGFIFHTTEVFYKIIGVDTLEIYAPCSSIQKPLNSRGGRVKIIPKQLGSHDEIEDYENNYERYGLSKISTLKE